jgi:hypothetical protein
MLNMDAVDAIGEDFDVTSIFKYIKHKHSISVDLFYDNTGIDLSLTGGLTFLKQNNMHVPLLIEVGHNDDSGDTLMTCKILDVTVSQVTLTVDGAVAVFGFKGDIVVEQV